MTATESKQKVVSREEWLQARKAHLAAEKALTRQRDELSRQRRELPWVKVEKDYRFDAPQGSVSLGDLFGSNSQLFIYHFMLGPDWPEGCPSCSMLADSLEGSLVHLANRDVTLAVVSRAPLEKIAAFQKRMGWRFPWVSSFGSDFNHDYNVSFTKEEREDGKVPYNYALTAFPADEAPGASIFYKNSQDEIFHTYSAYGRGLDILLGTYNFLDMVPKGRDEEGLTFPMAWVRHHDRYAKSAELRPFGSCCAGQEAS